ncbi:MAG: bifunctional pyr operon transcriptional regulator/uracil phosphoribosyltransferase PyrR [Candidatus Sumerlaeia bacterium]
MARQTEMDQVLLDESAFKRALESSAEQIARSPLINLDSLCFAGIRRRGVPLSERLAVEIERRTGRSFPRGALDITLYRDDLSQIAPNPVVNVTDIPFDVEGKTILLCDDVLFTGRTVRAALDALVDLGRPAAIRLWVMVDRGWREFPIQADFYALQVPTSLDQIVHVRVADIDGEDAVIVRTGGQRE